MSRRVAWFSDGAASAVATKLSNPDVIAYTDTGSEDSDNQRFRLECERWFNKKVTVLKNEKYADIYEVFEDQKYVAGIHGAPCTRLLKIKPRLDFQRPDDIHIFGYTCDSNDMRRASSLKEHWPELTIETPLIDRGITKAACLAMIERAGIKPPRLYALGYKNNNCRTCVKSSSPDYWALTRKTFPEDFEKLTKICRKYGARLARLPGGERVFIDEVPLDQPTTKPISSECDFLCQIAEQDMDK